MKKGSVQRVHVLEIVEPMDDGTTGISRRFSSDFRELRDF